METGALDYNSVIADIKGQIRTLSDRVNHLENSMSDVKHTLRHFDLTVKHADQTANEAKLAALEAAKNSEQAVILLNAATGIAGFVSKHGPRVMAALVGVLVYKGLMTPEIAAIVGELFGR